MDNQLTKILLELANMKKLTDIKAKLQCKAMLSDLLQQTGASKHQCIRSQCIVKNVLTL